VCTSRVRALSNLHIRALRDGGRRAEALAVFEDATASGERTGHRPLVRAPKGMVAKMARRTAESVTLPDYGEGFPA
jgi:hypothetical protein